MRFIYAKGKYISRNTKLSDAFPKHDLTRDAERELDNAPAENKNSFFSFMFVALR